MCSQGRGGSSPLRGSVFAISAWFHQVPLHEVHPDGCARHRKKATTLLTESPCLMHYKTLKER